MPNSVALEAVKTCMEEAKDGVFDLKDPWKKFCNLIDLRICVRL